MTRLSALRALRCRLQAALSKCLLLQLERSSAHMGMELPLASRQLLTAAGLAHCRRQGTNRALVLGKQQLAHFGSCNASLQKERTLFLKYMPATTASAVTPTSTPCTRKISRQQPPVYSAQGCNDGMKPVPSEKEQFTCYALICRWVQHCPVGLAPYALQSSSIRRTRTMPAMAPEDRPPELAVVALVLSWDAALPGLLVESWLLLVLPAQHALCIRCHARPCGIFDLSPAQHASMVKIELQRLRASCCRMQSKTCLAR